MLHICLIFNNAMPTILLMKSVLTTVPEPCFNPFSFVLTVFERGCHMSSPPHNVGCVVDGALTGLTCYCDTDRCNGLSIAAAACEYH